VVSPRAPGQRSGLRDRKKLAVRRAPRRNSELILALAEGCDLGLVAVNCRRYLA